MPTERKQPDLKPCPLCGHKAKLTTDFVFVACVEHICGAYIKCPKCELKIERTTIVGAIRAWNRRAK